MRLRWAERPDKPVWRAAREQLALVMPRSAAMELVQLLRDEPVLVEVLPSRVLLAARVLPLPATDRVVRRALATARAGGVLAPLLLVRAADPGGALLIADGYDRASAAHHARPGDPVPCRIVTMERVRPWLT